MILSNLIDQYSPSIQYFIVLLLTYMRSLLIYSLLLALAVLSIASPFAKSQLVPYQAGFFQIFFETDTTANIASDLQIKKFTLSFEQIFEGQHSAVISISGAEGLNSNKNLKIISIKISQLLKQSLAIQASELGKISSTQIAYLIYNKIFEDYTGVWFWNQSSKKKQISSESSENPLKITLKEVDEYFSSQRFTNQKTIKVDKDFTHKNILKVAPIMSSLAISEQISGNLVEISFINSTKTVQVQIKIYQNLQQFKFEVLFTIMVQLSLEKSESEFNYFKIIVETQIFTPQDDQTRLGSSQQKVLLFGLNSFNFYTSIMAISVDSDNQSVWLQTYPKQLGQKQTFSYFRVVMKQQKNSVSRILSHNGGSTSCPNGFYKAGYNWTYNSITSYPELDCDDPFCDSSDCMPCPIGCTTCSYVDCSNSWKVTCGQCNTNFQPIKTSCSKTQYSCGCQGTNFPDISGTCKSCSSIIANCSSCGTSPFIGTYCSTCQPGYYKVWVWWDDDNDKWKDYCYGWFGLGYPRKCAACPTGCTCSCANQCNSCFNNLIKNGSSCTCNTTNGLYYDSVSKSCTNCLIAIPGCLNCTLSGLTTSCINCTTGYYRDPATGTCVKCANYCNVCNATNCLSCSSSTFTLSGTSCVCASPLFLKTTPTPASCQSCTYFQPGCLNCSNATGSVKCVTCASSFYVTSGSCSACSPTPRCVSCTDSLSCNTCSNMVTMDPLTGCNCVTGYVLQSSTCVLCSIVIPNCDLCNSLTVTCSQCFNPYYLSGGSPACQACPTGCTSCTNATYCNGCIPGYDYDVSIINTRYCGCTSLDCTVNCPMTTSISVCTYCNVSATTQCLNCAPGYYHSSPSACTLCPFTCATCDSSVCITCKPTFNLISGKCVCNTALQQYFDVTNSNCAACDSLDPLCTSTIDCCTSCVNNVHAVTGLPIGTTCTACPVGWYPDPLGLNQVTCAQCPSTCTACNNALSCISCQPSYLIVGGSGVCACDTSSQYFQNLPNGCQLCPNIIPYCTTCALVVTTLKCTQCVVGYYINSGTFLCDICPSTCASCNPSLICDICQNTYTLTATGQCTCDSSTQMFQAGGYCALCYTLIPYCKTCILNVATVECDLCGPGTFSSTPTTCSLCGSNCISCTSSTTCQTCVLGFNPVPPSGGICTFTDQCANAIYVNPDPNCAYCDISSTSTTVCMACKAGYYVDNNVKCLACPPTCATCTDYLTCLICQPTFTLKNGDCICDQSLDQVLLGSVCVSCASQVPNCATCSSNVAPVTCTSCIQTFTLVGISCSPCTYGCLTCDSTLTSCSACILGFSLSGTTCNDITSCTIAIGQYYDPAGMGSCINCGPSCSSCLSATQCLTCSGSNMFSSFGQCYCDEINGYFYNYVTSQCAFCGVISAANPGGFPLNCAICSVVATAIYPQGFQCTVCDVGFYLSSGNCANCAPGCSQCTGISSCSSCIAPQYKFSTGNCLCNPDTNYFLNTTTKLCQFCTLTSCSICSSLEACSFCANGYFVNSTSFLCQPEVCGNGRLEGIEQCDDGNNINGDGCDSICQFQLFFVCINLIEGQISQCLPQNNKVKLQVINQQTQCNKITLKLQNFGTQDISKCDISKLLKYYKFQYSMLESYSMNGKIISYTFTYNHTVQGIVFNLVFDPTTLCVTNADYLPPFNITGTVSPTNNRPAIYYSQGQCQSHQTLKQVTQTIEYASYATLFLSALPCKIVGLQLFGVLQLAFTSLGSLNDINLMLQPLAGMGGVNGFHLDLGGDQPSRLLQTFTPQRINSIDYKANFLRNSNVMLLLVLAVISVSFLLYILTYIFKNCAPNFHRIAKRLIKEVLLTLILFNALNFAYTTGLHFRYAPSQDPLYFMGTLAAVGTLIIPVLMAIALLCTEEDGFGQFKDKLKSGCLEKAYFVITIVYRMGVGIYMSSANQDSLSTLILLAFSILFVVYNLVNLPFTKAYHNYRANICHITQFVILYVAMYYRSMKSTSPQQATASIFSPVYFQYVCIFASLVVSIVVLVYEIYLFIKQCCVKKKDVSNNHEAINRTENQVSQMQNQSAPQIVQEYRKQSAEYAFEYQ